MESSHIRVRPKPDRRSGATDRRAASGRATWVDYGIPSMNRPDGVLYSLDKFQPETAIAPAPPARPPVDIRRTTSAQLAIAVLTVTLAAYAGYRALRQPSSPAAAAAQANHTDASMGAAQKNAAPSTAAPVGTATSHGEPPQSAEGERAAAPSSTEGREAHEAAPRGRAPSPAAPLPLAVDDATFSPSFAPTGNALFFHAGRETHGRLLEADLDQAGEPLRVTTVLADSARNYHLRVSPNQQMVAFDSDRDGERGVYIARRDGRDAKRVSATGFAAVPSWSSDMKWLAFVRGEPNRQRIWNLWLRHLDTGALRRLTKYRFGQVWGASWFADARRLCYSHEDQLVILDIVARKAEVFRTPRAGHAVRTPAVSPDGQRIMFQVLGDGVWMLDLRARRMTRILDDATAEEFAWDPQGGRVAYHSRKSGAWRIWVANLPVSSDSRDSLRIQ